MKIARLKFYVNDLKNDYVIFNIYKQFYFNLFFRDINRLKDILKILKFRTLKRNLIKKILTNYIINYI